MADGVMYPNLSPLPIDAPASRSTRPRPVQTVLQSVYYNIDVTSVKSFVDSMLGVLTSDEVKKWMIEQGSFHVRMDLDLLSQRTNRNSAKLHLFSVDAQMLVNDVTWDSVACKQMRAFLKADACQDGGSENKLFYKHALSLKQFVLHELPLEEKQAVLETAYALFIGEEKEPGLSNIQTFSGIPFFHMKPFSLV